MADELPVIPDSPAPANGRLVLCPRCHFTYLRGPRDEHRCPHVWSSRTKILGW